MELKDKQIIILGEGISGKGAFDALEGIAARFFYYEGCLYATQPDIIVVSPGIAQHPAIDYAKSKGIPIISEIELGYHINRTPICAVTGTNGKTTVTRLIGEMANTEYKTIVCGNIGNAFSKAARMSHKLAVVEVSSFQLLNCYEFRPNIAVITNISPDHLDRHGSMEEYITAKMRITQNQTEDDFLICPIELKPLMKSVKATLFFSGEDIRVENDKILFLDNEIMRVIDVPLIGSHNLSNIMQSICAAKLLGVDDENIRQTIKNFVLEPHRLQLVSSFKSKRWYDDSKATNIAACLAACNSMNDSTALILGGSDKGFNYDMLFNEMPQHIKKIIVMGEIRQKLIASAKQANISVIEVENMQEAVEIASIQNVQNVLLSPAAASFDCYQNYAERGRAFLEAIQKLENKI